MDKVKFSSVTVTYNEAIHLDECLKSLKFCDENVIVDLGSSDETIRIAEANGARIIYHAHVPYVEKIRAWASSQAKNDWIVFVDPDMIFPNDALPTITEAISRNNNLGEVVVAMRNYYLNDPVIFGRWGTTGSTCIFNRHRMNFADVIHQGTSLKPGFKALKLKNFIIKHYWANSTEQLEKKHERYLKYQGEAYYLDGKRFSTLEMRLAMIDMFIDCYICKLGFLDFKHGWELTMLSLDYEKKSWLSLKEYQKNIKKT